MIEAPLDLQASGLRIPEDHLAACAAQGIPVAGNAAGNTVDLTDLSGERLPPDPLPKGWAARGIVAMAFSVLSAVLGCGFVGWYGMEEIGQVAKGRAE